MTYLHGRTYVVILRWGNFKTVPSATDTDLPRATMYRMQAAAHTYMTT